MAGYVGSLLSVLGWGKQPEAVSKTTYETVKVSQELVKTAVDQMETNWELVTACLFNKSNFKWNGVTIQGRFECNDSQNTKIFRTLTSDQFPFSLMSKQNITDFANFLSAGRFEFTTNQDLEKFQNLFYKTTVKESNPTSEMLAEKLTALVAENQEAKKTSNALRASIQTDQPLQYHAQQGKKDVLAASIYISPKDVEEANKVADTLTPSFEAKEITEKACEELEKYEVVLKQIKGSSEHKVSNVALYHFISESGHDIVVKHNLTKDTIKICSTLDIIAENSRLEPRKVMAFIEKVNTLPENELKAKVAPFMYGYRSTLHAVELSQKVAVADLGEKLKEFTAKSKEVNESFKKNVREVSALSS